MPKYRFGLAGDVHFGSAYYRKDLLEDYYNQAESFGCKKVFQVGDLLEGDYRHHTPADLNGYGFDQQAEICFRDLPRNLPTEFILGNHDEKFGERGQHPGKALVARFRAGGRKDLKWLGDRRGFAKLGKLKICLFHPSFGQDKASKFGFNPVRLAPLSKLERFLVSVRERENPDIVAIGHWHQSSYFNYRGMHVFLCGTFQGPGGSFSNSLDSTPALGSWLVEVDVTKTKKAVTPKWIGYGS